MAKLVSDVLSDIKSELDIDDTGQDTKIIRWINHAFISMKFAFIVSRKGYFLTYTALNVVAGSDSITLPSGLIQVKGLYYTKSPDDESVRWKRLELSPAMDVESRDKAESDEFTRYNVEGEIIRLECRPVTSVTGGLRLLASLSLTADLESESSIPLSDDFIPCLEHAVLSRYFLKRKDYTAHEYRERLYKEEMKAIKRLMHHRIEHIEEEIGFHPGEL